MSGLLFTSTVTSAIDNPRKGMLQTHSKTTLPVTIVTANYNNGRYLNDYLDSIMSSSVLPECVLVVDDGSTDNSLAILEEYAAAFPNLTIVKHPKNRGFAHALNTGMNLVSTEFVIRLDPDDWIDPKRIEIQVGFLRSHPEIGVVGSNVLYVNDSLKNYVGKSNFQCHHDWISKKYLEGEHGIMHGTICARAELFKKYQYTQESVPAEDYEIFSQMVADGVRFANVPEILSYIRVHGNSISNQLRYETINKTFRLRERIFNIDCSDTAIRHAFVSRKHYRIALFSTNAFARYYHLFIASIFNPKAVLRRLRLI